MRQPYTAVYMRLDFAMAYDPLGWRAAFVTLAIV